MDARTLPLAIGLVLLPLTAAAVVPDIDFSGEGPTDLAYVGEERNPLIWGRCCGPIYSFGRPGDVLVPVDYDGDGRDDPAVFRAGRWLVDLNRDGTAEIDVVFGRADDVPMTGDFDGDGRADFAVYRPSWGGWYVDTNRNGGTDHAVPRIASTATQAPEAIPTTGDYDGDGRTDLGTYFPYASWHWDVNLDEPNEQGYSDYACDLEFCRPLRTNGWVLDALGFFPPF